MSRYMKGRKSHISNKLGVVTATLLFYLAVVGIAGIGLTSLGGIAENVGSGASNAITGAATNLPDDVIDFTQLSYLAGMQEFYLENDSVYSMRHLYPLEDEVVDLDYGLLIIHYDRLSNAVGFMNFTDLIADSVNNRSFFVTINSNSTAVDPLNHTNCVTVSLEEGYFCSFPFRVDENLAGNSDLYEVDILSSSVGHHRIFNTVYLTPQNTRLTSADTITTFYFEQSKIVQGLAMDVLVGLYYFVIVGLAMGGILLIFITLKKIYVWVSTGGKNNGD